MDTIESYPCKDQMVPSRPDIRSGPYTITLTNASIPHGRSKITKIPSRILGLLLVIVVLQSCSLPTASTLGPDDFSLCQYLGLVTPASGTGQASALPTTFQAQNTELTGQYQDIEFIPVYPGAKPNPERPYRSDATGNDLLVTVPATITAVLQFYTDALAKNNWLPSGEPLPLITSTDQAIDVASATYTWSDPANESAWHIILTLNVGTLTAAGPATSVQLIYKRYPDIGKDLAAYPGAINASATCSENGIIHLHKADDNYRATVYKSYSTPASVQQVMDYYGTTLPKYRWFTRDDGTYNSLIPTKIDYVSFDAILHIKATAGDGGGTKVELTVDIQRRPDITPLD